MYHFSVILIRNLPPLQLHRALCLITPFILDVGRYEFMFDQSVVDSGDIQIGLEL